MNVKKIILLITVILVLIGLKLFSKEVEVVEQVQPEINKPFNRFGWPSEQLPKSLIDKNFDPAMR